MSKLRIGKKLNAHQFSRVHKIVKELARVYIFATSANVPWLFHDHFHFPGFSGFPISTVINSIETLLKHDIHKGGQKYTYKRYISTFIFPLTFNNSRDKNQALGSLDLSIMYISAKIPLYNSAKRTCIQISKGSFTLFAIYIVPPFTISSSY